MTRTCHALHHLPCFASLATLITSPSNDKIKLVRALQAQRRAREKERLFVIEGVRLAEEAVRARLPVKLVLHTDHLDPRSRSALNQLARLGAQVETVSPAVMAAASGTQTPQGLLAVVSFPSFVIRHSSFVIVLDRLSDPGNLGTILRTADAAGVEAVFLAPGTVDAYNPKVVRAALGAHFHLPI
ncbi:MAG: TrmH family RNA methyltransferase, partial [Anaerolineales bacterium]